VPRLAWIAGPAALLAAAFAAVLVGLEIGGGATPGAFGGDEVVLVALPIAKLVVNLGIAATLGALLLAVFALDPGKPEYARALDAAAAGAGVWAVSGATTAYLTFSSIYQAELSFDQAYGSALATFLTQVPIGRAWLVVVLVGALLTVVCFAVRNRTLLAVALVAAALGLLPYASDAGHSAGTESHAAAVTAIWLHTTFAAVWLGGLLTLVLLRPTLGADRVAAVLPRYSTVALICFIVVAISGYASAAIRIGDWPALLTPYGLLVIAKVVALGALGVFGAVQRRLVIGRIVASGRRSWFWVLVVAEVAFMGIASGVAAALARTATPVSDEPPPVGELTPAELVTDGTPLPPELTLERWFTSWEPDLLWLLVGGFLLFFYAAGVWRLHRRGDRWPIHRTVLFTIGILALTWVTSGPLNVYEHFLFSVHMLAHMLLSMTIPVLLVLSAPVTLALRAIRKRDDDSRGPREWILLLVHSSFAKVITHPLVAGGLFAASLWLFYYTPLFRWAVEDHVGHTWMVIHFLLTGYLFAQALVGVDPIAGRPPYPLRLLLLLATMAMHAFFGLAVMSSESLFLADWYGAMGRTWGADPLTDQNNAGGIAWSVGEIPTVSLAILVAFLWSRSDARDAQRSDRQATRDGDAELEEYNAMLAARASAKD
jgi:cytochrome c oxidase assembly factor CtaG/putative copper export protein